jgi:hypothetical protein
MDASQIFKIVFEGAVYDVFKQFVAPLFMSAVSIVAIRIISDKLQKVRDILVFGVCLFSVFFFLFYFLGTNRTQPQLVGGIQSALTGPAQNNKDSVSLLTMSIINAGSMQTILKNWNVEASLNGVRYQGTFMPMPDRVIMQMPDLGPNTPSSLTYHKEDDILLKSTIPLQGGALLAGVVYVLFQGVDASVFKNGMDITVSYEDVLSHPYAATIKTTARNIAPGLMPGLHTELVCRLPPEGPQISKPN